MQKIKRYKPSKEDLKDMLVDILTLQEVAKEIWGDDIYIADDYNPFLAWQYHLGRIVTSLDPKKTIKDHLNK